MLSQGMFVYPGPERFDGQLKTESGSDVPFAMATASSAMFGGLPSVD